MAEGPQEGPGRLRNMVDCERKSLRRKRKIVSDDKKKESVDPHLCEEAVVPVEEPPLLECAVCLQTCVYPARLPCSHIFCFLCLKGIASQSRRCAMCRQDIPQDYLEHPDLVQMPHLTSDKSCNKDNDASNSLDGEYQWFYEGRNGWWQYDERTSRELESSYKLGNRNCELLIAGYLYSADFDSMLQVRKNEPSRFRRIKRDLATIPKKGIAGIRSFASEVQQQSLIEQMSNLSISSPSDSQVASSNNYTDINSDPDQSTNSSSNLGDNCVSTTDNTND